MEARFTDFREEGRRLRQLLSESDPKAGQAFVNASRSPDYRALTDRRHELERAWTRASEAEKEAILAEMNALRERTTGMVMMELAKLNAAPAAASAAPVLKSEASQRTASTPAEATKVPAPPAPVVIM
jgi:sensor domain CHASE-containing protein